MSRFNFNESPAKQVAESIRDNNDVEQLAQPIPPINKQMQTTAQPATPPLSNTLSLGEGWGSATKGISVKLPYDLYDALYAIKKRSQRTGDRRDKMGIGDLVVLAVKEFVERNPA